VLLSFVESKWFPYFEIACALAAGLIWSFGIGELNWALLMLAALPWLLRAQIGQNLFKRTPFDFALLIFLVTAAFGLWISYDRPAAWHRLWVLVGAVFLYFALAGQPRRNLWSLATGIGVIGTILAGYFLLTFDWNTLPVKFALINWAGGALMSLRAWSSMPNFHPNVTASLLAITAPFILASVLHARRKEQCLGFWLGLAAGGLVLVTIFLTASRGAWLALAASVAIWLLWQLSGLLSRTRLWSRQRAFAGMFLIIALVGLAAGLLFGGPTTLVDQLAGSARGTSRVTLAKQTLDLIEDYPLTGGGLSSFPGLYSEYILVIPVYFWSNSHNLFLDAYLEQGFFGWFFITLVFTGAAWLLIRKDSQPALGRDRQATTDLSLLRWAALASMLVILLHGMVEDTVYASPAAMFLFALPGFAVAITRPNKSLWSVPRALARLPRVVVLIAFILVLALVAIFYQPLTASWLASLGAAEMARHDLVGFPTNEWHTSDHAISPVPGERLLQAALELNPENRTALHRLGLLAMLRGDFDAAVINLRAAHELDPTHRGIVKVLGYSHLWAGRPEDSLSLLKEIPEAAQELEVYSWWWGTQRREDLASQAARMLGLMKANVGEHSQTE
jgi:tetratricopeptide (TPR) repeat protein